MNWARLMLCAAILLALWLGYSWHRYRQLIRTLDAERDAATWTEDRL